MAKRVKKKKASRGNSQGTFEITPFWMRIIQVLLISLVTWLIYWPVLNGGWLWDDDFYVTANPLLHDPDRLWKTWFVPGSVVNYFPIEATLQFAQWQLWRDDTFGYHVTNVALHMVSALLVWRLLGKLGLRFAWLGGLLFAIHPTAVESVAWIAEFKNTLSLPPFLLAMCCWIDFEERHKRADYFYAMVWFLVAMLCKSTMVAFPLMILLYAWWKRGRIAWNDLKASAPFFFISVALGLLNVLVLDWFQQSQGQVPDFIPIGGLISRLACAGLSLSFYFATALWPVGLLPMYPQWNINPPSLWQFLPWPVMGVVAWWLWRNRHGWGRHVLLGLGFFFLNMAPFAGFITNSFMRFTWVMDHFLYIALIGLVGLFVAALQKADEQLPKGMRPYGIGALAMVVAFLAWESNSYAAMFVNEKTLWTYTIQHNSGAYLAYSNLGDVLGKEGRPGESIEPLLECVRINPRFTEGHYNLACAYFQTGRMAEAEEQYQEVLRINPRYFMAYTGMGNIKVKQGRKQEAGELYVKTLQINPNYAEAHNNLGNILTDEGQWPEALDQYDQALRINPDFIVAHNGKGLLLAKMGRIPESIAEFQEVLRLNPNDANAQDDIEKLQNFQSRINTKKMPP